MIINVIIAPSGEMALIPIGVTKLWKNCTAKTDKREQMEEACSYHKAA